jgi:hypothetical protein
VIAKLMVARSDSMSPIGLLILTLPWNSQLPCEKSRSRDSASSAETMVSPCWIRTWRNSSRSLRRSKSEDSASSVISCCWLLRTSAAAQREQAQPRKREPRGARRERQSGEEAAMNFGL